MSSKAQYRSTAERPVLEFWLFDRRGGGLVDLSGSTFVLKVGNVGETALLTKSTGLAGAVGSGDGSALADVPNLVYTPAAEDFAIAPGSYAWQVTATESSVDHVWVGTIDILPVVL